MIFTLANHFLSEVFGFAKTLFGFCIKRKGTSGYLRQFFFYSNAWTSGGKTQLKPLISRPEA